MERKKTGGRNRVTGRTKEELGIKYYILGLILEKYEKRTTKSDWRQVKTGNKSLKIQQEHYDDFGKTELIREIRELERQGLIRVKYFSGGSDVEKIIYNLGDMEMFYKIEGRRSERNRLEEAWNCVGTYKAQAESFWLQAYYEDLLRDIDKGKCPDDFSSPGELLFRCLNILEKRKEPMFVRIFSSKYLGGSKVFENNLRFKVIKIAKKYHPMADHAMEDYQVLDQLYLETYAQSLELKGELKILLAGREVDLSEFPYGAVLNTETLKKAEIGKRQKIRKIITVENKANYMSMAYEKGTLILFCHGFFSPLERDFLVKLEKEVLEPSRQAGEEMEYWHTGDLDYGGVRIFRYIRTNIFPRLQPWQMDVEQYERYQEYALEMTPSSREELKDMKEPLLQPLIDRIVAEGKVIEQECFLFEATEEKNDL